MAAEARRRERGEQTISEAWPEELGERVLAGGREDDAFAALAWRIDQTRREGQDPAQTLRALDEDTLGWVIDDADNPAAFLTSRVGGQS